MSFPNVLYPLAAGLLAALLMVLIVGRISKLVTACTLLLMASMLLFSRACQHCWPAGVLAGVILMCCALLPLLIYVARHRRPGAPGR